MFPKAQPLRQDRLYLETGCGDKIVDGAQMNTLRGEFELERETKLVYGRRVKQTAAVGEGRGEYTADVAIVLTDLTGYSGIKNKYKCQDKHSSRRARALLAHRGHIAHEPRSEQVKPKPKSRIHVLGRAAAGCRIYAEPVVIMRDPRERRAQPVEEELCARRRTQHAHRRERDHTQN